MSWTSLSGQNSDTIRCYNRTELVKIATKFAKLDRCDSLLSISKIESTNLLKIIHNDSISIESYKEISNQKEIIITGKTKEIKELNTTLTKTQVKLKGLKAVFAGTSGVMIIGIITLLLL